MDAFAQLALMVKMDRVFASEGTFLSFPALTPLSYPPERLRFAAPGETSAQALSDLAEFSRITNRIPRGVLAPVDDEEHLWDVYGDVLRTAQVAQGTLSPEDSRALDEAMSVLYARSPDGLRRDSKALSEYKRCRDAYIAAQEAYKSAQVTALASDDPASRAEWDAVEPALRAEVDRLDEQWRLQGHKAAVESAQQIEESIAGHAPGLTWEEWRSSFIADLDLNTDTRTVRYAVTGFSPYDLFDRGSWPSFTLSAAEMSNLAAQAPPELSELFGDSSGSNIESVSFEYRSVGLVRPWLRTSLFRSRFWRLPREDAQLSDGNDPPTGRCPAYVTALVFARNVVVRLRQAPTEPAPATESPGRLLQLQPDAIARLALVRPDLIARAQPRPAALSPQEGVALAAAARRRDHRLVQSPQLSAFRLSSSDRPRAQSPERFKTRLSHHSFAASVAARQRGRIDVLVPPVGPLAPPPDAVPPAAPPAVSSDITVLAFICKRLPRCPDPDPSLDWPSKPFPLPSGHRFGRAGDQSNTHSGRATPEDRARVRDVQARLVGLGWTLVVDGLYGAQTERAVREFQAQVGLVADGLLGEKTWAALWQ